MVLPNSGMLSIKIRGYYIIDQHDLDGRMCTLTHADQLAYTCRLIGMC